MNIELQHPIVFFDLETTGINIYRDRIVQIAMLRVTPEGEQTEFYELINPGCPIPAEAAAVHGIQDADVAGAPSFAAHAEAILDFLGNADLAGYNILFFDLPLLQREFKRIGMELDLDGRSLLDVYQIFRKRERHTLSKAMEFYCGRELVNAHDAMADVRATLDVFNSQLKRYPDLPTDIAALDRAFTTPQANEKLRRN